ncbi:MAG: acetyl-CoA carboxylase biotin carboxyl carrier protein [Pseudomonadota bacterium]|nr:acetyl-CoA carboxylase biotin carboxyl carrier protein [Pseudomonadota bacterium]
MTSITKIKQIIELLKEHDLGEIHVQYDTNSEVTVKSKPTNVLPASSSIMTPTTSQESSSSASTAHEADSATVIKSPMVGTVYLTPSPEAPAFVQSQSSVQVGDTLCLIEAMKMFNKITSEKSGKISKILVENGATVEFDQPLFLLAEA